MKAVIRPAVETDAAAVIEAGAPVASTRAAQRRLLAALRNGDVIVAVVGETIAGVVASNDGFFGHRFITLLAVPPAYRRRGLASRLLDAVLLQATTDRVFISTNESNAVIHELCRRHGFVRAGVVDHLDPGDPEVFYVRHVR